MLSESKELISLSFSSGIGDCIARPAALFALAALLLLLRLCTAHGAPDHRVPRLREPIHHDLLRVPRGARFGGPASCDCGWGGEALEIGPVLCPQRLRRSRHGAAGAAWDAKRCGRRTPRGYSSQVSERKGLLRQARNFQIATASCRPNEAMQVYAHMREGIGLNAPV